MTNLSSRKHLIWISIAAGLLFSYLLYHFRMWFLDDSFISMRYARNWASGNGLVFNIGERIEGYTNFLWVALMSFGFKLGLNVPLMARVSGIALTVFVFAEMSWYLLKKCKFPHVLYAFLIFVFVSQGAFAVWANSGMETMLFTFMLTSSVLLVTKSSDKLWYLVFASFGFVLATLTRPDGMIGFVLSAFFILICDMREYRISKQNILRFFCFVMTFLVLYTPYFIWRYNYFGWLFPNTFYAKVAHSSYHIIRGGKYSFSFMIDHWFILAGLAGIFFSTAKKSPLIHYFMLIIFVYTMYIIYIGGDVFPAYRFFIPILPLIYLCFAEGIFSLWKLNGAFTRRFVVIALILCVFLHIIQLPLREDYQRIYADKVSQAGRKIGLWLRKNVPSSTVIALNPVGAIPYFSRLYAIDMLGLTDEYIAHHSSRVNSILPGHEIGDGSYVLSRQPDIIIFDGPWGDITPLFKSDCELAAKDRFWEEYQFMNIPVDRFIFQCFVRKQSRSVMERLSQFSM